MDGPRTTRSAAQLGPLHDGMTRRQLIRALAAGSAALATVPLTAAFGAAGEADAARALPRGQAVDVTLITVGEDQLPYPAVPTAEEQAADPALKAYAQAIQPWLDQNPGVKLKQITFDVYDQETLLVAISGGTAPSFYPADVLATWDEPKVLAAEKSGLAADVTEQVKQYDLEAKLADYCLPIWKTKEIDGHFYALPYSFNCGDGIHYRIDFFKEAGLPEPTADWTWEKVRELAKALTTDNRKGIGLQSWGFQLVPVAEGWDWRTVLPAPDASWHWRWDYTSDADEWAKLIAWERDMVFGDQSVLADIAMEDDQIVAQFLQGTVAMMNNNVTYHSANPSAELSMAATADQLGKPVQEVFGFIRHPIGRNGFNQTTFGQLDTMAFNPDLDPTALDKATSLHVYMMGPGTVIRKKAAYEESKDLRYVWSGGDITPLYKPSELEGIPGSPAEAWGEAFMKNVLDAGRIPLMPRTYWFIPPEAEAGPATTPVDDAVSKWFYQGGDQDIVADLKQLEETMNQQAATFTSEIPTDQFVTGAKQYYDAVGAYFQTNAPDLYANVYKPWYDSRVAPILG